mgnify:FL=1|tara:strand:+ start:76 stop:462 length:387 start_codon:yes stop_codon:yes gene_type:complete
MGIVLSVLVAVLVIGCGVGGENDKNKANDESASGKALFIRNGCAVCHGNAGRGDGPVASSLKPPPRDFRDRASYKKGRGVEAISETIKLGVPKSAMPAYPHIVPADRRLLALFIESLQSEISSDDNKE